MRRNKIKPISAVLLAVIMMLILLPIGSYAVTQDSQPPGVVSSSITPRTIAYQGNAVPGYLTATIKTDEPTRGYIDVIGNGRSTRINLSTFDYKTEHVINWAPWDDSKREPLPPGEYSLKLNLSDQALNQSVGMGLGKITVVAEPNPKPDIDNINVSPMVISPKYDSNGPLTEINFQLNRPSEVQLVVRGPMPEVYHGPKQKLEPGLHKLAWDGRDDNGNILPDGEYTIVLKAIELDYNYPDSKPLEFVKSNFIIKDGEFGIPKSRLQQMVPIAVFNDTVISPNGDGIQDTVSGTFTLTESAKVSVYITNAAGGHVTHVMFEQSLEPGTHSFTWNGTDFSGGSLYNGTYGLKLFIIDKNGVYGYLPIEGANVILNDSVQLTVPQPVQQVRVTADILMDMDPARQGYRAKAGEVFSILRFQQQSFPNDEYAVRINEGVVGYVKVSAVDMINLDSIPIKLGQVSQSGTVAHKGPYIQYETVENLSVGARIRILRQDGEWYRVLLASGKQAYVKVSDITPVEGNTTVYTIVAGDTLWKISQKFSVTVNDIVKANNLDLNKYLTIGQKLVIPVQPVQPPSGTVYYVQSGDTLWKIAAKYGVTVSDIVTSNNLDINKYLYIGQKLVIPTKTVIYTVQSGDTLWKIAQKYGTTVQNIAQLNQIDPGKPIYIGQQLKIFG